MKEYVGNTLQIRGAERYILQGGKGEGMHFIFVRNGKGLEAFISLDRAGDISRINFKGENMGFFSPCGYVSPEYYDDKQAGFLKSFTAGFFTTCGLTAVGSPCTDDGEELPLHGTVSHIPADNVSVVETEEGLQIFLTVSDCVLGGRKYVMKREYFFSYSENIVRLKDTVTNEGDTVSPFMLLYHCNMGYPLLSENSLIKIPNNGVTPRNTHAEELLETALKSGKPQSGYEECCYYYDIKENNGLAKAGIYNSDIDKGVVLSYNKQELPCFTQWKMLGFKDYVLGLEPGNCTPDGRDVLRKADKLCFLNPGESKTSTLNFIFTEDKKQFEEQF